MNLKPLIVNGLFGRRSTVDSMLHALHSLIANSQDGPSDSSGPTSVFMCRVDWFGFISVQ